MNRRRSRVAAIAAGLVTLGLGAGPADAQVSGPVFIDGQAQPVFTAGPTTWVRQELWVESQIDNDFDGKLDRIHVDVTRVQETETIGLKVPVVFEVSPYYGGSVDVVNWSVDHEIGQPPTTRPVTAPVFFDTSPIISNSHVNTWVPRGFAVVHAPYPEWPDPKAAGVTLSFNGNGLETGQLTLKEGKRAFQTLVDDATISPATLMNASASPNRLLFKTPALLSRIRISGTPTIQLTMAFGKPKANLTAHLISYPAAGGNGTVISRGWIDPENRHSPALTEPIAIGKSYRLTFDFQPKDSVLAAGRRLGVMILSSDRDYTVRPAPGTELTLDLKESKLRLPIVGGPSTFTNAFDW